MRNHQRSNLFQIRSDLFDVFDHEERFQHIHVKTGFCMFRIQNIVVQSLDNDSAVGVIKEFFQWIIEQMERHQPAGFIIHNPFGGFLEERQHGTFAF